MSRVGAESDAADIAQEAYLRLMRVEKPELIRKPDAYLFRIASNLAGELQLKRASDPACVPLSDLQQRGGDGDDAAFATSLERRAEIARLETILDGLPPLYRAVLLLKKRDGYTNAEIAERLNLAPSSVPTYLKRALAKVRACWPA